MEKTKDKLEQAARVQEISVCPYNNNCSLHDKCYNCQWGGASKQIRNAGKEAFIAGANWQKEQSPWISVEDVFPKERTGVFFIVKWGTNSNGYFVGLYNGNGCFESDYRIFLPDSKLGQVTYWMSIPKFNNDK